MVNRKSPEGHPSVIKFFPDAPYLYGPLPEFLKTYRNVMALEDGDEDGEADNHVEVPFRVLFLSLASSCLVSPGLNIYRTCGNL